MYATDFSKWQQHPQQQQQRIPYPAPAPMPLASSDLPQPPPAPQPSPPMQRSSASPSVAHFSKKKYLLEQHSREQSPALTRTEGEKPAEPSAKDLKPPEQFVSKEAEGASPYRNPDSHHFTERGNKIIPVANVQPMRKLSEEERREESKDEDKVAKSFDPLLPLQPPLECATVARAEAASDPNKDNTKDLSLHFVTPKGRHKLMLQKAEEEEEDGEQQEQEQEEEVKTPETPVPPPQPQRTKRKYVRRKNVEQKAETEVKPKRKYVRRKPLPTKVAKKRDAPQVSDLLNFFCRLNHAFRL
jgi:hypothetical protein